MTPKCLMNNVCHRPTIHRLLQSSRTARPRVFRATSSATAVAPSPKVRGATRRPAVGPPPGTEPARASEERRRCPITPPVIGDRSAKKLTVPRKTRPIGHQGPTWHANPSEHSAVQRGPCRSSDQPRTTPLFSRNIISAGPLSAIPPRPVTINGSSRSQIKLPTERRPEIQYERTKSNTHTSDRRGLCIFGKKTQSPQTPPSARRGGSWKRVPPGMHAPTPLTWRGGVCQGGAPSA